MAASTDEQGTTAASVVRILAIDGSPSGGGRTETAVRSLLAGAEAAGAESALLSLADVDHEAALDAVRKADAFVFCSPVYRGSYAAPLKAFLDVLPRGMWGEKEAPITGRAVAMVMTGATWHHYLGLGELRNVLASFFGAHVLTPGLYVPTDGFDEHKQLVDANAELARSHGAALVALARAIAASADLSKVRPQA